MRWSCILCGSAHRGPALPAERDGIPCSGCGSAWLHRALGLVILKGLGLPIVPLSSLAPDLSRRGLGISDAFPLAAILGGRFDYTNSWYHRFPKVDLTSVPAELRAEFEFVVCSEVLEHVPPPVQTAMRGIAELLRPGLRRALSACRGLRNEGVLPRTCALRDARPERPMGRQRRHLAG